MIFSYSIFSNFCVFAAVLLLSCGFVAAQGCPTILIETPRGIGIPGEPFVVSATMKNVVGTGNYGYKWTVSGGVIDKGQGSASATIVTSREDAGTNITVKVFVEGLSSYCENVATETVGVAPIVGCVRPLDDFGAAKADDVQARIDNIYIQINNVSDPNFRIIFDMEFAESESIRERKLRIDRILHSIYSRKFDPRRVSFVISNERARTETRVWATFEENYISEWANRGILIDGQDMKHKLPTLFQ